MGPMLPASMPTSERVFAVTFTMGPTPIKAVAAASKACGSLGYSFGSTGASNQRCTTNSIIGESTFRPTSSLVAVTITRSQNHSSEDFESILMPARAGMPLMKARSSMVPLNMSHCPGVKCSKATELLKQSFSDVQKCKQKGPSEPVLMPGFTAVSTCATMCVRVGSNTYSSPFQFQHVELSFAVISVPSCFWGRSQPLVSNTFSHGALTLICSTNQPAWLLTGPINFSDTGSFVPGAMYPCASVFMPGCIPPADTR
mmetsp:Transcript_134436/g.429463  ORF Transcript_134436/g.429463 Transcript_134436/m.429463 type:complete len:257 (+) Transcript_134436:1595-2365(+)